MKQQNNETKNGGRVIRYFDVMSNVVMNDGIEAMNDGNMTKHEATRRGNDEVVTRQHTRQC